jgi:ABC-type lipoprotein export system ATPase subunit
MPADMGREVVRLHGICKTYGPSEPILIDHADLTIAEGESVAVTGPSGSGKSTLIHIVGGLVRPELGTIALDGVTVSRRADWDKVRARLLGFIFQDGWLLPGLTAGENVELPMFGIVSPGQVRRDRVAELLSGLGMSNRTNINVSRLSGGERQRVAFARALANRPKLILADEPTGNLDSVNTQIVVGHLHDLCKRQGTAILMVTHDQAVAATCNRHLTLIGGRLIAVRG